ncbi:MAG: methylmalonyl-CoA mutase family protein [Bacteroidales bacterium]|jgi:methylmalonyl-CoA mutase|nr:methylmalonyl-CoA mutase family protein [Bacteroidales bacterium]
MSNSSGKLFEEFAPVSAEEWKEKTIKDIKGADYEKRLVWRPVDGFRVEPIYRQEDLSSLSYLDVLPGEFPYIRGTKTDNDWYIRQDIRVKDVKQAHAKALNILLRGVTSLGFIIDDTSQWTSSDMSDLLQGIELPAIEICFVIRTGKTNFLSLFVEYVKAKQYDLSEIVGSINADYIGNLTLTGAFCFDSQEKCETFSQDLFTIAEDVPRFKTCEVHADYIASAGASITQELSCGLAIGAEYLSAATAKGIDAGLFAPRIKFNFAVSSNYFMEIAKFRAARFLWAKIVSAFKPTCNCDDDCCDNTDSKCSCGGDKICTCAGKINIHAITSTWNKTIYDPYVNMLRTQTEAMSATIAGVDSLTVLPFNAVFDEPSEFSERIARNQQNIIREECHFHEVVDPSAGSYYIEELTDKIIEKSWEFFLTIQDKGGFIEAFKAGFIQDEITKTAETHNAKIASRRENILGVNQFPNFTERAENSLDESLFKPQSFDSPDAIAKPLALYRGAQTIELLRYKTDTYAKENKRPKVFMIPIGHPVFRTARAQFSCNFFACAGFEVMDNKPFSSAEEGVKAAQAAQADIVVVCSSDDEYMQYAVPVYKQLQDKIVAIAGDPASKSELEAEGIEHFVSVKSNLLETLQMYQGLVGIK